jgi:protein-tyrosine phosphatase
MIDWHSHILPAMDDGSRDVDESLLMLELLEQQAVKTVIVTPHFYANEESVDEFLDRRRRSFKSLSSAMGEKQIQLLCGAEVRYYPGIGRMKDLEKLTIEGTNLLLLEMPMGKWTEATVQELTKLSATCGLKIVMAHIDRYLGFIDLKTVYRLCECGVMMQVNSSFFDRVGTRRKALKMLDSGLIHFVGSDCHNLTTRPPKMGSAYAQVDKRFGGDFITQMTEFGYRMLGRNK